MIKQSVHNIKGMQRDLTVSKFNPEFVFDAQNIRITARDHNTLLSITNEKGNKEIILKDSNGSIVTLQGTVIGYNVLNNYLTLFTTDNTVDRIYRLERKSSYFECTTLYTGSLNFNTSYPIESIGVYENENIQKVYWIDGENQARVINITSPNTVRLGWTNSSFDFVQELNLEETITVSKNNSSSGAFASGVIQYAFTYYNRYGQESNIFYTTPLQYISFPTRGANPEDKVSCSFTITISNPDPRFDFIRIYSIHRTSIDGTPTVTNIVDLSINSSNKLTYVDNGGSGVAIDPTELLYIGGESIIPKTMTSKDNTLFLGNIRLEKKLLGNIIGVDASDRDDKIFISFSRKNAIETGGITGYYPYKNTLNNGAQQITTFHSNEWYRFGIQFQYKTGKWSEPIFLKDAKVTLAPSLDIAGSSCYAHLVKAVFKINSNLESSIGTNIIREAVSEGFVRARGVIVYPDVKDREVIAQGILCPTVYNLSDRFSNSPYAQASWFLRPSLGVDINNPKVMPGDIGGEIPGSSLANNDYIIGETPLYNGKEIISNGVWAEFRHNRPIPSNWRRNAEIQCIANAPDYPYVSNYDETTNLSSWIADKSEYFFIDQSVVTLHSPEFEFDDSTINLDLSSLKLRIVGRVPFTGNASDIDIQTSTPQFNTYKRGFYKEPIGTENISAFASRGLVSGAFYFDSSYKENSTPAADLNTYAFFVYPWHRNGSLNNQGASDNRTAMLSQKKMSNLKFSIGTEYFKDSNGGLYSWKAEDTDENHTGISGAVLFNLPEKGLVRLPHPKNSDLEDINYYGNVDKVVTASRTSETYSNPLEVSDASVINYFEKKNGYPIVIGGFSDNSNSSDHELFVDGPKFFGDIAQGITQNIYGTEPVSIKYKSTPHVVMAFNYTQSGKKQVVLPTGRYTELSSGGVTITYPKNRVQGELSAGTIMPWDTNCTGIYQDVIPVESEGFNNYGYLWMGELYRDSVENRFGGTTPEALENNLWVPAGNPVSLIDGYDTNGTPLPKEEVTIEYTEGDTYFQRYDCLKTYPYTMEDQNSIVEIASFMCETRVNIDGRYDRNRGQVSNLVMTPENFNLINPVYTQKNSFFNYRAFDYSKYNLDYFPNTITWTKEKQAAAVIDTWTNITMASTLDLDGDKGEVVSLNTFNNEIFCFQEQGLSNILFNSRVQIPTSDGMPIEISNGLKVDGKRYISSTIGCNNKWSIVETSSGLYFIDNITNSIYLFNGQISSLSDRLGFRQWVNENNSLEKWDPVGFRNFVTHYDKNNGDVYFVNNRTALVYSELLGQFTSFMSYGQVPAMFDISNDFYAIQDGKVWEQFAGDYNKLFGHYCPYSVTFVSNADEPYDKIFNTVEFRADCWAKDDSGEEVLASSHTFDTLEVWNEYQKGVSSLTKIAGKPSSLKKKFRVWRANIPRANTDWNGIKANNRDRIRNTWAYIRLSMNDEKNTDRMEFHDMIVHYFV